MAGKKQETTGAPDAPLGAAKPGKDSNQPAKAKAGRNLRKPKPGAPEPALTSAAVAEAGPAGRQPGKECHPAPSPQVVGIGASAGGLEAFTGLLENLPIDTGMAFVLVQHMAPRPHSLLPEILTRVTRMPVIEVKDGQEVKPNHVYVSPPEVVMSLETGILHLTAPGGAPGVAPSRGLLPPVAGGGPGGPGHRGDPLGHRLGRRQGHEGH